MAPGLGLGNSVTADPASTLFASTPLLLDSYPNAHRAYSVRKLSNDYTGYALKVRESGNDYTADVGFDDDGRVSASSPVANLSGGSGATLGAFIGGSNDGFVTTWYDQSGEGVNAVQGTAASQPKLYSSGSLNTEGDPARAALLFDGSNDAMAIDEAGLSLGSVTVFAVFKNLNASSSQTPWFLSSGVGNYFGHFKATTDQYWYDAGSVSSATANTDQKLFSYKGASGSQILFVDGSAATGSGSSTDTSSFTDAALNGLATFGGFFNWQGEFQEFIVYDSDQESNRTNIESDITTEFGIS